jgi:hypothetical protein
VEDLPERNEEKQIPAYKFRCPLQQSYEHTFKQQFLAMQNSRSIAMNSSRCPKDCVKKGISDGNVECRSRKILKEQNLVDSRTLIFTVHFFSLRLKTKTPRCPHSSFLTFSSLKTLITRALFVCIWEPRAPQVPHTHTHSSFLKFSSFGTPSPPRHDIWGIGEFQHHPNRCSEWGIGSTLVGRIQVWYRVTWHSFCLASYRLPWTRLVQLP